MAKVALSYGHGADTYEKKRSKFVVKNGKVYEEHTHNAEVGKRLAKILKAHGVQVLEVQPAYGSDVPLATRTNKANSWKADIYWSIHVNAGASSARGWCGFYWKGSSQGLKLAQLYAKHVKALGLPAYSSDYMYPSERGTWSDFHELRETAMPALLTENGFMTNASDFEYVFLNKGGHWDKLARAHAKAILEYFGIKYDPRKAGEITTSTSKPAPAKPQGGTVHTVCKGDTLWELARKYGTTVAKLKELNGLKSDLLQIGQKLVVGGSVTTHTVKKGDSLWEIARKYNTTVAKIKSLNGLKSDVIQPNQKLRVK